MSKILFLLLSTGTFVNRYAQLPLGFESFQLVYPTDLPLELPPIIFHSFMFALDSAPIQMVFPLFCFALHSCISQEFILVYTRSKQFERNLVVLLCDVDHIQVMFLSFRDDDMAAQGAAVPHCVILGAELGEHVPGREDVQGAGKGILHLGGRKWLAVGVGGQVHRLRVVEAPVAAHGRPAQQVRLRLPCREALAIKAG